MVLGLYNTGRRFGMTRPNEHFVGSIKTVKGPLRGHFETIYRNRALTLLGAETPKKNERRKRPAFGAGCVFIRNLELKRRTHGETEWMAVPGGLYEAWRTGGKIERRICGLSNGESDELRCNRDAAQDYVEAILGSEFLDPELRSKFLITFNDATAGLGMSRNPLKALAERHFSRAQELKDATGRRNPGAAAMRVGAGIGMLKDREDQLDFIMRHVGVRTFHMYSAIRKVMAVYEGIRWHLNRNKSGKRPFKLRLFFLLQAGDARRARFALEDIEGGLEHIHANPFRANAFASLKDVREAKELLLAFGTDHEAAAHAELDIVLRRLHQGIAWPLARDFLELQIIAPLSWLLSDMERDMRRPKKANARRNGISREDAPERFDALAERIRDFRSRAFRVQEDLLRSTVKADVLKNVDEALEYVRQDDWESVKEELKTVSSFL
jgi:hypothetical protein